jgi:hypothetical protein
MYNSGKGLPFWRKLQLVKVAKTTPEFFEGESYINTEMGGKIDI